MLISISYDCFWLMGDIYVCYCFNVDLLSDVVDECNVGWILGL